MWESNLDDEIARLRKQLERFPIVAVVRPSGSTLRRGAPRCGQARATMRPMNGPRIAAQTTEFPGVVLRPLSHKAAGERSAPARDVESYHYETMRLNVEQVRMVQLGLALFDEEGNMPPSNEVWQFHMRFSADTHASAPGAVEELARSGVDVDRLAAEGIEAERLGEVLMVSGLVLVPGCSWAGFHSGYDLAYLVKVRAARARPRPVLHPRSAPDRPPAGLAPPLRPRPPAGRSPPPPPPQILTGKALPEASGAFFELVRRFFPSFVDCKCLAGAVDSPLSGGLAQVARGLSVPLPAASRQAAPRCVLTMGVYLSLVKRAGSAEAAAKLVGHRLFSLPGASSGASPSSGGRPAPLHRRR